MTSNQKVWLYLNNSNQAYGEYSERELAELYQYGFINAETYIWKQDLSDWIRYSHAFTVPQTINDNIKIWFYLDKKNKQFGPFTVLEMANLRKHGNIHNNTLVWKNGLDGWVKFSQVSNLFHATSALSVSIDHQERTWVVLDKQNKRLGPYSHAQLVELHDQQRINRKTLIWKEGYDDWKKFYDVFPSMDTLISHSSGPIIEIPTPTVDYNRQTYLVTWLTPQHRQRALNQVGKLISLLSAQKKLESIRMGPARVDGEIIGTGEADFTKGNVNYEFNYKDKTFQLIDVPGIEGDESKYEKMVEQAIAKAHLVFYVNGTNKKPEEKTAKKIKEYINQYAKVYAICNVRGKADAYEFEEDQESLEITHGEAPKILKETLSVLEQNVGAELIEGGQCLQGLLAFSSLAYDKQGNTTISATRVHDLVKVQKGYYLSFNRDALAMKRFSQVEQLEQKIITKFATFKHDIIESNKRKIVRKIEETIEVIQINLDQHNQLQQEIKEELDQGAAAIQRAVDEFAYSLKNKRDNAVNQCFENISEQGCYTIQLNFGEKETIQSRIQRTISDETSALKSNIEKINKAEMDSFQSALQQLLTRLGDNISRVQARLDLDFSAGQDYSFNSISGNFSNNANYGKALFSIGGYMASGFTIGSAFPVVGIIAGTVIGFLAGLGKVLIGIFTSKETKIREAQNKFRSDISSEKYSYCRQLGQDSDIQISQLREHIQTKILNELYSEFEKMVAVQQLLTQQITNISTFKHSIENKDYGTI